MELLRGWTVLSDNLNDRVVRLWTSRSWFPFLVKKMSPYYDR